MRLFTFNATVPVLFCYLSRKRCDFINKTTNAEEVDETVVETVYDVLGRTIAVNDDGKITVCTYDSKDNVLTITVDGETTTYSYTENGNLVSRTNPNGAVAGYTYDAYGNLTGHTFNGYAFTYNTLGSILTASSESGQLVNFTYSSTVEQEVLTSNYGNGQSVVYTYNDEGAVTAIKLGEETKYGYEYFETTDIRITKMINYIMYSVEQESYGFVTGVLANSDIEDFYKPQNGTYMILNLEPLNSQEFNRFDKAIISGKSIVLIDSDSTSYHGEGNPFNRCITPYFDEYSEYESIPNILELFF